MKEKLMDFCDVLNIPINKGNVKKVGIDIIFFHPRSEVLFLKEKLLNETCFQEELSAKLLEFLEAPHATTDVLLAEKEQVYYL